MSIKSRPLRFLGVLLLGAMLPLTIAPAAHAQPAGDATSTDDARTTLLVDQFVALPAMPVLTPALAQEPGEPAERMSFPLQGLQPEPGTAWDWPGAGTVTWTSVQPLDGTLTLGTPGERGQVRLLAFRIHADAFTETTLRIDSAHRLHAWLDGKKLGTKKSVEKPDADPGKLEEKLKLTRGDHVVVVVAEVDASGEEASAAWTLRAQLEVASDQAAQLSTGAQGINRLDLADVLDGDTPSGIDLSADGRVLAITVNNPAAPRDGRRTWVEFVDTTNGRVLRSLEGMGALSGFQWATHDAQQYSFVTREESKASLWIGSLAGGTPTRVLEGLEDFGSARWMPGGKSMIFSRSEDGPEDPKNFKRYRGLSDRWGGSRNVSSLYQVSVPDGIVRRLTDDELGTSLADIAPDGSRLLFTRSLRDDATWPFAQGELVELDLNTLDVEVLATELWGLGAQYGPRGESIAITGPAQAFDGLGVELSDTGVEANLYDTQLFLMDRGTRQVRALSKELAPSIESVNWVGERGEIVARVTDQAYEALYHYDVARDRWQELRTPMECVTSFSISDDGKKLAFLATSVNVPSQVWVGEPRNWKPTRLRRFEAERFDAITFGEVKDWDFDHGGETIDGHVYYPPDFDPAKKWPVIVYYYGGTTPVTRTFGGRYPKEWWAAQGYLVYVMQPSGATGFGQDFAARHVNNWGKTVADEIIACTKGFLAAHAFADPQAVGCIGASYGGFMTMLLTTRTDIFAAAVSHAGISSISSYWGEGNWGFAYSAGATARSYPWNRPDIYVDQSPLFAADQIHTPLLLLHGGDDDNVPPGESEQLYTALRVLGREVEYIRIAGEKHWILDYDKRERWSQSIVAWFDKHLKKQDGWWEELWPADEGAGAEDE